MTKIKKGSLILFAITIIYLIFGSFICKDYITYVAHNNTIDYTKKYYDDLNRLLGPGWVVQGTENGYINSIGDYLKVKVISWEINYQDKAGNNQTLLLSNFQASHWDSEHHSHADPSVPSAMSFAFSYKQLRSLLVKSLKDKRRLPQIQTVLILPQTFS